MKKISLLAKWLKSPNTSSKESRELAKLTYQNLGISEKTYRKTLSRLRKYIGVLERTMSDNEWTTIDFSKVPSIAMHRYIGAFNRRLPEQFAKYKEDLANGKTKVNASTLFPYDITQKFFKEYYKGGCWNHNEEKILNEIDEAQWKTLPNYINEDYEIVCLCDVSGSMTCNNYQPIATSVGLTTYFAQRNKGAYHGKYLTFSSCPRFISLDDNASLEDTLRYVVNTDVGYSTNLDAAMAAIYSVAKETRDVPQALLVISDMEIDRWQGDYCDSIISKWDKKYKAIGLDSPKIILWNVESRHNTYIAPSSDKVAYVSGYGIGPFGNLKTLIDKSAYDAAVEILMQPQFCWN